MVIKFSDYHDFFNDDFGFKREVVKELFKTVHKKADQFLANLIEKGFITDPDLIELNENIYTITMLDAFADIKRLKEFHDVKIPSNIKIASYISYWWIQRKPFQYKNEGFLNIETNDELIREKILHFNEFFIVYFILSMLFNHKSLFCDVKREFNIKNMDEWNRAEKYLFYFLCYRAISPKSIEAFLYGSALHPVWEVAKKIN